MTRTMYDAITPAQIPAGATMVAGYVGGQWPSYAEAVRRFPHAVHVSIAVQADEDAQVLDCERYDATPQQCPGWAVRQRHRGQVPTVYCNTSTWPSVRAAFRAQGVPLPLWWAAQYDNDPALIAGAVAKQYRTTPGYDVSSVVNYWPGVDPAPKPPAPVPVPPFTMKGPRMIVYQVDPATLPPGVIKNCFRRDDGAQPVNVPSGNDALAFAHMTGQQITAITSLPKLSLDEHKALGGSIS